MELDKEIKKINFALDSYPCGFVANYETTNHDISLILKDSKGAELIKHTHPEIEAAEMLQFKKEALKLCSHA